MEPKNHPRQEDTHVYDEIEMESKKISSEGLEEDSALITLKNENESTSAFENDSREEAYSIKDKDPELSGDDRGIESEIDGSDDDDSQKNESDSTSSLDDNDKEAYPKNDKVSDFKDDERGIESEIDGFDDDSSQKNESDSTSSLGNNDKEAYPKNDKVSGFKDDERGTQSQTTSLDGSESTPSLSSKTEGSKRASKSSLDKKGNKDAYQMGNMSSVLSTKSKVCNYGKGRWVVDNRRPLYSGLKCKQWLSEMWACRLTERSDFSYEAYRWQPENCEMPEFDRSEFLRRMQDKTIAFIGDSLGRQQYQSLLCMVTGGEEDLEVQDVGSKYGFVLDPGAIRPNGWAFWFPKTNTTILFYWSACLCDLEPLNSTDSTSQIAMHLDRPPSFLKRNLPNFDVLILNTGHHWNRGKVNANRWVMYSDGKPVTNKRLAMVGNAKNFTIHSVARWLDNQLRFHPHVKAFFRTISPRHFFNGDWNTGGSCENTTPLAKGSAVLQDGSSDTVIASAVNGTRVRLLDITALSTLRDEGHISRYSIKSSQGIQDCLHWCLPGIPDTWNEIVSAQV